jgi:hypothetical protein
VKSTPTRGVKENLKPDAYNQSEGGLQILRIWDLLLFALTHERPFGPMLRRGAAKSGRRAVALAALRAELFVPRQSPELARNKKSKPKASQGRPAVARSGRARAAPAHRRCAVRRVSENKSKQ